MGTLLTVVNLILRSLHISAVLEKLIDIFGTVPNSTTQCVKGLNKSNISIFKVKTDVLGKKHIIKKR